MATTNAIKGWLLFCPIYVRDPLGAVYVTPRGVAGDRLLNAALRVAQFGLRHGVFRGWPVVLVNERGGNAVQRR